MLVSRMEYNALVAAHAEWMRTHWDKLDREWFLAGVRVTGEAALIVELSAYLGR